MSMWPGRMFIISVADNTSDKAVVTTRLLKNYDDMADAFKPYYGNQTGDKNGDLIESICSRLRLWSRRPRRK